MYCSPECRTVVTNARVLEKYHEKQRLKKLTGKRICKQASCVHILSVYNKEDYCEACKIVRFEARLKSWGWTDEMIEAEREQWL